MPIFAQRWISVKWRRAKSEPHWKRSEVEHGYYMVCAYFSPWISQGITLSSNCEILTQVNQAMKNEQSSKVSLAFSLSHSRVLFYNFSYSEVEVALFVLTTMDHHGPPGTCMPLTRSESTHEALVRKRRKQRNLGKPISVFHSSCTFAFCKTYQWVQIFRSLLISIWFWNVPVFEVKYPFSLQGINRIAYAHVN